MVTTILLSILTGGAGGFYLGRLWAENTRATHDMKRVWDARHSYHHKR